MNRLHSRNTAVTFYLMLATDFRIIVLELQVSRTALNPTDVVRIVLDIEFPIHYDFVFDHDSAIIIFELAPHASILSLTQAQRGDIPNRKFSTAQGYAVSQRRGSSDTEATTSVLAILVRDKHTDLVVVMEKGSVMATFRPDTIDAHGLKWSPDGKPMLMVWDSPAYGAKLSFFSAMGHPLRQFNIGPESPVSAGLSFEISGTGVSCVDWVEKAGSRTKTKLAIGNGSGQIMVRSQGSQSLTMESQSLQHTSVLCSSTTAIWQHLGGDAYRPVEGVWDLGADGIGEIELVAVSCQRQQLASKVHGSPNVVFIWDTQQRSVLAAIIYQKEVRQLIWDNMTTLLLIVTAESTPSFHYWPLSDMPPGQVSPPLLKGLSSSRWEGRLLHYYDTSDSEPSFEDLSFFMLSSAKHVDIVRLDDDDIEFPSIFDGSKRDGRETPLDFTATSDALVRSMQPAALSTASDGSSIFF
ncbi:hypothetical protein LTR70_009799 [Exophiala xenobiotica]|uniref:Uncharacterized protein n=1 Tax=Lithohypha guttulata TaxID=1690604 RepID=A0ABR0JX35_9EURO|nr:hypothetical protein LTR24_009702 [Lithohypha guttulata]KAK5310027.1 hypothetical protein LTR70_009799 [Exophiala xenobiotica]